MVSTRRYPLLKVVFGFLVVGALYSKEISPAREAKLLKIGEKVSKFLCKKEELDTLKSTQELERTIKEQKLCQDLDSKQIEALALYLKKKSNSTTLKKIGKIPKDKKCIVCGMYPYRYPLWVAKMRVNGEDFYFDGVKDMMKYYLLESKYPFDRGKIDYIYVQEFYRLERLNAKDAWYVVGSDVRGPMGYEPIPFKSQKEAKSFLNDHRGRKILRFEDITIDSLEPNRP